MKKIKYTLAICALLFALSANAEKVDTASIISYIKQYKNIAVEEMKRSGIPASITLAQGIHESSYGTSYLSKNTNNHFGIKCKENWTGKTFKYTDDAPNECFRVYDKVEDSYKDHSDFLRNRPYYTPLFILDKYDYKGWALGLKKAGYATNPKYAPILIKTIEDFQLYAFDKGENPSYITAETTVTIEQNDEESYIVTDSLKTDNQAKLIEEKKTEAVKNDIQTTPLKPNFNKAVNKTITKINNVKSVKLYNGETLDLIANVLKIEKEDLMEYNDIKDESLLKDGQIIFLQHKKKFNKEEGTYRVRQDDNIWSISQKKGIRLASLLKMNKLELGEEPAAKEIIYLKEKTDEKPKLRPATLKEKLPVPYPGEMEIVKSHLGEGPIVRARDTIYPPLQEPLKSSSSLDSSKLLGWEKDTKLLENPGIRNYPAKGIPVVKDAPTAVQIGSAPVIEKDTVTLEKPTPTVYPKSIDYNKLPKSTTVSHIVIKGDTMYNICKRYNISITQIMEWNDLSEQSIKLGQVLKIQP